MIDAFIQQLYNKYIREIEIVSHSIEYNVFHQQMAHDMCSIGSGDLAENEFVVRTKKPLLAFVPAFFMSCFM